MKTKIHPRILQLRAKSKPFNEFFIPENKMLEVRSRAKKIEVEEGQTAAYFAVWGVRDDRGTGWLKGTFNKSIRERGPQSKANQKIFVAWMHDLKDPIGRPARMGEDDFGAYAVVDWDDPQHVPNAGRAKSQLDSGTLNGWSFGFDYVWDKMEYDEKTDTVWGREADLYEISPVSIPAIKETMTIRSKSDLETAQLMLKDEMDNFIMGLPRTKQLELRQLLTKHISLAQVEPDSFENIKRKTLNRRSKPISLITQLATKL